MNGRDGLCENEGRKYFDGVFFDVQIMFETVLSCNKVLKRSNLDNHRQEMRSNKNK